MFKLVEQLSKRVCIIGAWLGKWGGRFAVMIGEECPVVSLYMYVNVNMPVASNPGRWSVP